MEHWRKVEAVKAEMIEGECFDNIEGDSGCGPFLLQVRLTVVAIQGKRHVCEHFVKRLQDSQVSLPSCATPPPLHPWRRLMLRCFDCSGE